MKTGRRVFIGFVCFIIISFFSSLFKIITYESPSHQLLPPSTTYPLLVPPTPPTPPTPSPDVIVVPPIVPNPIQQGLCVTRPPLFDSKTNYMARVCAPDVGRKLNADGSYRRFYGITAISFLYDQNDIDFFNMLKEYLENSFLAKFYSFLPLDSYHVTIFDVTYDERANSQGYGGTAGYIKEKETELCDLIEYLNEKEESFDLRIKHPSAGGTLGLLVEPTDANVHDAIYNHRYTIGNKLQNDRYKSADEALHLTFGYMYIEPLVEERARLREEVDKFKSLIKDRVFKVKSPKLTQFDDMSKFNIIDSSEQVAALKGK